MSNPQLVQIDVDLQGTNLNVPVLRQSKTSALISAFLYPVKKLQSDINNNVLGNSTYTGWATSTSYALNDRVQYGIRSYECILPHTSDSINSPPNTTYWYCVSTDNIGITERLNYNCSKMQLEYILNKRFNGISSILPPYNSVENNIYITNNDTWAQTLDSALIGINVSSYVIPYNNPDGWYCPTIDGYAATLGVTNYTIFVPNTILSTLGSGINDIIMETNKYNAMGLTFNVIGY